VRGRTGRKKLTKAARFWAAQIKRNSGADESAADAEAFGLDPGEMGLENAAPVFWVHPENWETVRHFLALDTQWRQGLTGLDYAGVNAYLNLVYTADKNHDMKALFANLQKMEFAAVSEYHSGNEHE